MKKKIAFSFMMGIVTTGLISFTLVTVNVGMSTAFMQTWIASWAIAYAIVVPAILLIGPPVQKLVDHLFKEAI